MGKRITKRQLAQSLRSGGRTIEEIAQTLKLDPETVKGWFWDGEGENPVTTLKEQLTKVTAERDALQLKNGAQIAKLRAMLREAEAESAALRRALEDIVNPIMRMQRIAWAKQKALSGEYAVRLSESASFLSSIAKDALESINAGESMLEVVRAAEAMTEWYRDKNANGLLANAMQPVMDAVDALREEHKGTSHAAED